MAQRSILITGCSSGIGYHAAHALKARGWLVFATCRREEDIARLMREINQSATAQTQSVGEVTSAVRELDQTTQQNAALVEQTAAASNALADQAKRLNDEVSNFRLA